MSYDEGWKGKWIHAPGDGRDPEPRPVTVQEASRDESPMLYIVERGITKALYRPARKAGF